MATRAQPARARLRGGDGDVVVEAEAHGLSGSAWCPGGRTSASAASPVRRALLDADGRPRRPPGARSPRCPGDVNVSSSSITARPRVASMAATCDARVHARQLGIALPRAAPTTARRARARAGRRRAIILGALRRTRDARRRQVVGEIVGRDNHVKAIESLRRQRQGARLEGQQSLAELDPRGLECRIVRVGRHVERLANDDRDPAERLGDLRGVPARRRPVRRASM